MLFFGGIYDNKTDLQIKTYRRDIFDMIEFGEQLRRAREEKGMTQQSLAEELYVTRQAVSRWECGDRYPDLLTTKKISQILDVSLDELLSGKEMVKVVERNPVIEKRSANNVMIALYAFVVISYFVTIVDILIRVPFLELPLKSGNIDDSHIELLITQVLGLVIRMLFFAYGFFHAIRGTLSPKKMGAVIMAYFGSMCITTDHGVFARGTIWQLIAVGIFLILPNMIGAVAAFFYFIRSKNAKIWLYTILTVSVWGIAQIVIYAYQMIRYAGQFLSMDHTVRFVLEMAIYGLILYQTSTLNRKRRDAIAVGDEVNNG